MSYDTTPEPRFLRGMQNQKWTVAGALAELVDNSYGPGRGDARSVTITYDAKKRTLAVLDDGVGMGAVGQLLRLGATAGRAVKDIGEYGSGGTLAILWLYKTVTISTMKDGMVSTVRMRWPEVFGGTTFPQVPDEWHEATPNNTPESLYSLGHGTLIQGQLLNERRLHVSNVCRDLAAMFAPGIRYGKELMWQDARGDARHLSDPLPSFESGKSVSIDLAFKTPDGNILGVRGEIGEIPDLPLTRSRVHVGFGPRVIMQTRDFFEPVDGEERFRVAGIAGWLDLLDGWQPYLATTKDDINDTPVYQALRNAVFQRIEHLLRELRSRRETILLDDLMLDLNQALDIGIPSEIPVTALDIQIGNEPTGQRHWNPDRDSSSRNREINPDGTSTADAPRVAKLELATETDIAMSGRLCHAEKQNGDIAVFINEDHSVVRTALEKEPPNRLLLAVMVLREVAHVLDADEQLRKKIFRPKDGLAIERADDDVRQGLIHRVLVDRVHVSG